MLNTNNNHHDESGSSLYAPIPDSVIHPALTSSASRSFAHASGLGPPPSSLYAPMEASFTSSTPTNTMRSDDSEDSHAAPSSTL